MAIAKKNKPKKKKKQVFCHFCDLSACCQWSALLARSLALVGWSGVRFEWTAVQATYVGTGVRRGNE